VQEDIHSIPAAKSIAMHDILICILQPLNIRVMTGIIRFNMGQILQASKITGVLELPTKA
jgi:hypothetical protein